MSRSAKCRARAFTIPTDKPEADGTIAWRSTTLVVVEINGGDKVGVGYTYSGASIAQLIESKLADTIAGLDALNPEAAWQAMQRAVRNLGREGLAATAISAVDIALHDLKARILDLPLGTMLGQLPRCDSDLRQRRLHHLYRRRTPEPARRLGGSRRLPLRQDEGRHQSARRSPARIGREESDRKRDVVRRCQRRLRSQAGPGARAVLCRTGSRLVRGAGIFRRSAGSARRFANALPPAWRSPPANMLTRHGMCARCWRRVPSTCSKPT